MRDGRFVSYPKNEERLAMPREAELYTVEAGEMFRTPADHFVFRAHGRLVYTMPYAQALRLYEATLNDDHDLSLAINILKAFCPQLDLKVAADIIRYLRDNFKPCR